MVWDATPVCHESDKDEDCSEDDDSDNGSFTVHDVYGPKRGLLAELLQAAGGPTLAEGTATSDNRFNFSLEDSQIIHGEENHPRKQYAPLKDSVKSKTMTKSQKEKVTRVPDKASGSRPRPNKASTQTRPRLTIAKEFSFVSRPLRGASKGVLGRRSEAAIRKKKPAARVNGMTLPKPFKFQSDLRMMGNNITEPKSPYVPLAVKVKSFESAGTSRGNPGLKKAKSSLPSSPWRGRARMTRCKSPFLMTKFRTKPPSAPTREQLEEEELAAIQPFKAKPVDPRILAPPKPPAPTLHKHLPTIPQSPAITKPTTTVRPPSPPRIIKANPISKAIFQPFQPVIEHRTIAPGEFELPGDDISRKKKQEFQERLRQMEEEKARAAKFHARPLPSDTPDSLPAVSCRQVTNPKPFNLETDIRGDFARLTLQEKLEQEEYEKQRAREFHANPLPLDEPFRPEPSSRPLTNVSDVVLNTDLRAEERKAFEDALRQKEAMEQELRETMRKERELREMEEIKKLREQQVHKAQPVLYNKLKPVQIKPSNKKLTEPESPYFAEKRRRAAPKQTSQLRHIAQAAEEFNSLPSQGQFGSIAGGGGSILQARLLAEADYSDDDLL
ncbi:hypothetical protein DFS34DRAFT_459004 [Phlyctochytrium arcticum]|nr:hypothetical protein DFS34DRAFT_459004 [Phlyctochytrium arcticum]